MENRFKTELGCEVASNTLYGWLLGAFWVRIGCPNFGPFSQIGGPELSQICLHRRSRHRHPFCILFGSKLNEFGTAILVYFVVWG